jgi:3-deoxy-manno-octulosonate cytidylyltransferase (CMP-KDO synthetase)
MSPECIIVIPARFGSTRLPGKALVKINQITLLERVWRIAKATKADDVIIATDDNKIIELAKSFGAKAMLTSLTCNTGTDRVAEIAQKLDKNNAFYINLQGDALLTPPWVINDIISALPSSAADIITPARKLSSKSLQELKQHKQHSPSSGTTVVFDKNNKALYFSKYILPFNRDNSNNIPVYKHIGLYAYSYKTLLRFKSLPKSNLEDAEKLEQLRALEHGMNIQVVVVDYKGRTEASVDTKEDVKFVEKIIDAEGELI